MPMTEAVSHRQRRACARDPLLLQDCLCMEQPTGHLPAIQERDYYSTFNVNMAK